MQSGHEAADTGAFRDQSIKEGAIMSRKQKAHSRWRRPAIVGGIAAFVGSGFYAMRRRRNRTSAGSR